MPLQVTLSLTNIFQFVSFMSPVMIVFFILLLSIINNDIIKGLVFNGGIIILSTLVYILKNILKSKQSDLASPFCNIFPGPFTVRNIEEDGGIFDSPSLSSSVLAFTIGYLVYPMILNVEYNFTLVMFLISLFSINAVVEYQNACTNLSGIILGGVVGIIWGLSYYTICKASSNDKWVYFTNILTNNKQCGRTGPQNFKCDFYKNGQKLTGPIS